ncbi:MAG: ABC transporter ATP-binding protein [Anaerolineae bacterium]|nr:ABC transporter ATP-binding protein [Anaerolineae bacterium]
MSAIRFEQVSKQYAQGSQTAVANASFAVAEGSFVVLLGPSGCGKTTLLKMVNRLIEPTSGTIYLDEQDSRTMDATTLRRQIGYVIQQIGLFPHMTVAENVAVVPDLLKWPKQEIVARVDEMLALVDLPPEQYRDRYPAQLSGGQQQRVGVARALAGDPKVILMDEPFGAVDAITRTGLQEALLHLQRRLHKTILFVTHDVEEALRLADKMVVMKDGRVHQYDTPFNILKNPADDFVRELVGADDMVRQLGLIRVEAAMQPLPPDFTRNGQPTIPQDSSLRQALSLLLGDGVTSLVVTEGAEPVGVLTLRQIQRYRE